MRTYLSFRSSLALLLFLSSSECVLSFSNTVSSLSLIVADRSSILWLHLRSLLRFSIFLLNYSRFDLSSGRSSGFARRILL